MRGVNMLVEKPDKEYSAKRTFEFLNVNYELLFWLENIIEENNCKIERKEWKSKYNNYVIYEYEPFCPEGFTINVLISSNDFEYINFVRYLYDSKVNIINRLERCII